jgi:hypothetical protein
VVLCQQYGSFYYKFCKVHTNLVPCHVVYTKKSQWDKPTEPAYPAGEAPLDHAPPAYAPGGASVGAHSTGTNEKSTFGSNNPYANISEDEKLARKLQEEEETRARSHGPGAGPSHDYYSQQGQAPPNQYGGYPQQSTGSYGQAQAPGYDNQTQDKGKSKGLLGKLISKAQGHGSSSSSHGYPQQQQYGQPGYGAPMGGTQYYQQPGRPMMGGMGGMPGRRPGGGGMGAGGAMALGAGGGLLGGALLGSAMADAGDGGDGGDYGGDGGDYGGDGGDFGGDMGGDMGGGDF